MPDDDFVRKIEHAARAAWTVVLVGFGLVVLGWLGYLAMSAGWLDPLVNAGLYGDVPRGQMLPVWFGLIGAFKLVVLGFALGALWLTLWARRLRRG